MHRLPQSPAVTAMVACLLVLAACVQDPPPSAAPHLVTPEAIDLPPPPPRPLTIGVYNCIDTTGQRRPTSQPQELSTAVPLDCTPYLVEAIRSLRPGYVFLVERQHLDELLRERQLATLALNAAGQLVAAPAVAAGKAVAHPIASPPVIPPRRLSMLRVAEVLLVGQVVAYDRSTREITGGLAIGGIGGNGAVVTDLVTFSLRAIAVQTGEIIGETTATKSITSVKLGGHTAQVFSTSIVEAELGGAGNEPVGLALCAAIHSALDQLVQNGIHDGWWA